MVLEDHSSMATLTLYSCFSGESSGPLSGLLLCSSPAWRSILVSACHGFLQVSSRLVHALNTSFISERILKETNGVAEAWHFHLDQRDHISKESGHDTGLKNCFWGFENFILVTCISQLQKVIYTDILWLGLMLNDPFCGITYQLRKISWFWVQFSHLVVHI